MSVITDLRTSMLTDEVVAPQLTRRGFISLSAASGAAAAIAPGLHSPVRAAAANLTLSQLLARHDPVMGVPNNDECDRLAIKQWPACRTYSLDRVIRDFDQFGSRVIAVTSRENRHLEGGSALAEAVERMLEDFYYGNGSNARKDVELHIANGNEVDRDYERGDLPSAFVTTYDRLRDVVWKSDGGGRRYPNAKVAVDLTQRQIRVNDSGKRFKRIARYLDVFAASMYPPGRQQDPVEFTPYGEYCDEVFETLDDWRRSGGPDGGSLAGQLDEFATWEFGIPIDHARKGMGAGGPTGQTNFSIRPRYCVGGRDTEGETWTGFLPYVLGKCDEIGVRMREQIYWNQQSNPEIPNQLWHDKNRADPDTEQVWHNWTP